MTFPIYVDDTIDIRLLRLQDTLEHYTLLASNRDHLAPHFEWVADATLHSEHERIENFFQRHADQRGFAASINYRMQRVGEINALTEDDQPDILELCCWLDKYHTGRGIMTLALKALIPELLADYDTLIMDVARSNKRARALAERLDFTKTNHTMQPHRILYIRNRQSDSS